jgi:hypothetical protein
MAKNHDFRWLIKALEPKSPLAVIAREVGRLSDLHGSKSVELAVDRPKGWVSKMRRVDREVRSRSVAGTLVSRGAVKDLETAYYVAMIESKSPGKAKEIAANIKHEKRVTVKQAWAELR